MSSDIVFGIGSINGPFRPISLLAIVLVAIIPTEAPWMGWGEPSVTSFEAFRATYDRAREMRADPNAPPAEPLADEELRRRFEALRADRAVRNSGHAQRSLVTSILWLFVSIALFIVHWRWLARRVHSRQQAIGQSA